MCRVWNKEERLHTRIYKRLVYMMKRGSICEQRRVYSTYGVATVSRIDKIIGLFCKRDL